MGSDDSKRNNIEAAYGQAAKVAEIFWEWRHKVMTRFFAATAGVLVAAGWFYKEPELRAWMFAPLVVGACFSMISHLLDRANTHVLRDCYRLAREIEDKMIDGGGIFKCIENIHYQKGSYQGILRFVYLGTAAVFVALGDVALLVV